MGVARGKFIVLEGIDGSGKSTQMALLQKALQTKGVQAVFTFEPTKGRIGSMIREAFSGKYQISQSTIAALFVADRMEHIQDPENGMLALLQRGIHVFSDRYYFSSYAYHSAHVPMDWVVASNALCKQMLQADLTLYLDHTPEQSMKRLLKSRGSLEMYETLENLSRVYSCYEEAMSKYAKDENIIRLPAHKSAESLHADILKLVERELEK